MDTLPNSFVIPKSPISEITSIKYQDSDDSEQTLSTDLYDTDFVSEPCKISVSYGSEFPDVYDKLNAVVIRLICGYGAASAVPDEIKTGMYLYLTYLYEHRGDESIRPPRAIYDIWNNYRVQWL